MKKRFRSIKINGKSYSWSIRNNLDGDGSNFLKIWETHNEGKNIKFDDICDFRTEDGEIIQNITPRMIKNLIDELERNK